jgi:hypothetical protein
LLPKILVLAVRDDGYVDEAGALWSVKVGPVVELTVSDKEEELTVILENIKSPFVPVIPPVRG